MQHRGQHAHRDCAVESRLDGPLRSHKPAAAKVRSRWGRNLASRYFAMGYDRGPNRTGLLTKFAPSGRERESFGQGRGRESVERRSRPIGRELSRAGHSPQVVARLAENDERRELSLSAFCVNPWVGGNSANQKGSPCPTLYVRSLFLRFGVRACREWTC